MQYLKDPDITIPYVLLLGKIIPEKVSIFSSFVRSMNCNAQFCALFSGGRRNGGVCRTTYSSTTSF